MVQAKDRETKLFTKFRLYIDYKGGIISESFSLWLQYPKNQNSEHYPLKAYMLRIFIWYLFLEVETKVKNFVRLSHL